VLLLSANKQTLEEQRPVQVVSGLARSGLCALGIFRTPDLAISCMSASRPPRRRPRGSGTLERVRAGSGRSLGSLIESIRTPSAGIEKKDVALRGVARRSAAERGGALRGGAVKTRNAPRNGQCRQVKIFRCSEASDRKVVALRCAAQRRVEGRYAATRCAAPRWKTRNDSVVQ
jgi:hypothetical protein